MNYKKQLAHFNMGDITKPHIVNDVAIALATDCLAKEKSQVIIKLSYSFMTKVRIWPTTYLICKQNDFRSKLLFNFNIGEYPLWSTVSAFEEFSLVFDGLPQNCTSFDLYEDIPEPGEFHIANIQRNKTDVYNFLVQ